MDKQNEGAVLSGTGTAGAATQDMGGAMGVGEYAALLQKAEKAKAETETKSVQTDDKAAGVTEESVNTETEATAGAAEDGDKTEGQEQPKEQPESEEEEEVLSKSDSNEPDKLAKWQEKTQKRINALVAEKKAAEEAKAQLEAELAALKTRPQSDEKAPDPITVPVSDPGDKTGAVFDESEIQTLEREAQTALEFIEANQPAIMRAIAKDEATVKIGNEEFSVDKLNQIQRDAKKHLERFIPQRKQFLAVRSQSVAAAKQIMPALFDKRSKEYQEIQQLRKVMPAVNSIPVFEQWYALGKLGQAYLQSLQQQQKKPEVKPAAETPPKAAADTAGTAAPAKKAVGDKARLKAQLDKAEKDFNSTGSKDAYARMEALKSRLKKIS